MTDIYIVGIGMTALGKFPDKSVKELTNEAVSTALTDAGATMGDVEAAWFSNTRQGMMEGQNTVRGQCALRSMGFESIPIVNVENACCSSSTGLNQAYAYLKAGMGGVALVAGSEVLTFFTEWVTNPTLYPDAAAAAPTEGPGLLLASMLPVAAIPVELSFLAINFYGNWNAKKICTWLNAASSAVVSSLVPMMYRL